MDGGVWRVAWQPHDGRRGRSRGLGRLRGCRGRTLAFYERRLTSRARKVTSARIQVSIAAEPIVSDSACEVKSKMKTHSPSELAAALRNLDKRISEFWLADVMPLPGVTAAGIRRKARRATKDAMAIQAAANAVGNRDIAATVAIWIKQVEPYMSVTVVNEAYKDVVLGRGIWATEADRSSAGGRLTGGANDLPWVGIV